MANPTNPLSNPFSKSQIDLSVSALLLVSSSPQVKKNGKTDEEIVAIVRPILEKVKRTVLSSHDIIPQWDRPRISLDLIPAYYKQHGEKFLDLMNCVIERDENNYIAQKAKESLQEKEKFQAPTTAELIATSKLGKGECLETTALFTLKCNLLGLETFTIAASTNKLNVELSGNHCFCLLGIDVIDKEQKFKIGTPLLETLNRLKQGVLVDPFLNVLCPLKDLNTQGLDFLRYTKLFSKLYINEARSVEQEHFSLIPQLEKESEKIYHLAQELLSAKSLKKPLSQVDVTRHEAKRILINLLSADILLELQKISGKLDINLPWKKNIKAFKFWIEGSQKEIIHIQEQLQKVGMILKISKVTTQSNEEIRYAGFLENSNLKHLQEINSRLSASNEK